MACEAAQGSLSLHTSTSGLHSRQTQSPAGTAPPCNGCDIVVMTPQGPMRAASDQGMLELLPPTVDNVWAPFGFGMLSDARAMCGVYCDEINYLYRPASRYDPTKAEPPATATVAWGQTCVTRLVNLGKDTNCLVMCSGSASVLRAMVFPVPHGPWRRKPHQAATRPSRSRPLVRGAEVEMDQEPG